MTSVYVVGAKGGVGTSIVAANVAIQFASLGQTLLVDGMPKGSLDLLLGMPTRTSWRSLLPVAGELKQRHVLAASGRHRSGLRFLGSTDDMLHSIPVALTLNLARFAKFIVVDLPAAWLLVNAPHGIARIAVVLVTTLDPLSLRRCRQTVQSLAGAGLNSIGLVLSQTTPSHPGASREVTDALGAPVLASIPYAPEIVFNQVQFGCGDGSTDARRWIGSFTRLSTAVAGA